MLLAAATLFPASAQAQEFDAVLARWQCNIPECSGGDWIGAVIDWPSWSAYHTNDRRGYNSRSVFSFEGEPLYPYMGPWADGCEVTVVEGLVLMIEWERGTDLWRQTLLGPGDTYVIDLVAPEDGAMIEGPDYSPGFRVSLANCAPQPIAPAGLTVSKTDGQATATPGTAVAYTITVSNSGPDTLAALALTDVMPAALSSPTFTPSSGTYDAGTGAWTGITLAPGGSVSMGLAATIAPAATGALVNTVTVATVPPAAPANGSASDSSLLVPSADLEIVKSGPPEVQAGQEVTYLITVTNRGPSDAQGVTVADSTPPGLVFVSNSGDCSSPFPCNLGTVPAGASRTITATFAVPSGYDGP